MGEVEVDMRTCRGWRTEFLKAVLGSVAFTAASAAHAQAQPGWKPGKAVEVIVQSSAGSGVDRTARVIQKYLAAQYVQYRAILAELGLAK